jgi:hypothetical protein
VLLYVASSGIETTAPTEVVFHTFLFAFLTSFWHVLFTDPHLLFQKRCSLLHSALVQVRNLKRRSNGTKNPRATLAVSGSFHNCLA